MLSPAVPMEPRPVDVIQQPSLSIYIGSLYRHCISELLIKMIIITTMTANDINSKDRRRGGGGKTGIATAPVMPRLTPAINTTQTSAILVCTLPRLNSARVFWCSPCASHCARH